MRKVKITPEIKPKEEKLKLMNLGLVVARTNDSKAKIMPS